MNELITSVVIGLTDWRVIAFLIIYPIIACRLLIGKEFWPFFWALLKRAYMTFLCKPFIFFGSLVFNVLDRVWWSKKK